jgi:uncharacterized protein YycO
MKMRSNFILKRYPLYLLLFLFFFFGCSNSSADQLHDGDIIFQTSLSNQSAAIQLATHSKYSHVGMIFFQDGAPYVFEAARTVQYTPLKQWMDRGEDGKYVIKRLRTADSLMTPQSIEKLKEVAATFKGKPYDLTFEWSDDSIYCSELVWKIYDRGMGVHVGQLKKLRDFDLSSPAVKNKMKERYGDQIPMDETVVSPGDMFSSELLQIVSEN